MWSYEQATGYLISASGIRLFPAGYSGSMDGGGKNDPTKEAVKDIGPIPRGKYTIGAPVDTVTHGPYVLPLTPAVDNQMYGRSGFLIHGDSVVEPGTASEGCIVQSHVNRVNVWESRDHDLEVV